MKNVIIINYCDEWKSYTSMRLFGVFSNRKKLNSAVKKLINKKYAELKSNDKIEDMSISDMQSQIQYLSFEEITLNKGDGDY